MLIEIGVWFVLFFEEWLLVVVYVLLYRCYKYLIVIIVEVF